MIQSRYMAKRGRKPTPAEIKVAVVKKIALGHTDKDACELVGIAQSTFYEWMNGSTSKGQERAPDVEFVEQVKKARLASKDLHLANIRHVAVKKGQWFASAWMLERRFPEQFALRIKTENTHLVRDYSEDARKRLAKYQKKNA